MDRKALFKKWNAHKEHTYDLSETFDPKDDEGRHPDIAFIYSGRNRIVTGRIYRVYFSTKECETDVNTGKKKLRGVKVWWLDVCPLTIHPDAPGGPLFLESVFNFCEAKTGIKPFVPGNAHDFVYRPAKTEEN